MCKPKQPEVSLTKANVCKKLIAEEINMTAPPRREPFAQIESSDLMQRAATTDFLPELLAGGLPDEWQMRLRSLQQWVCELLIKNQQLRMALMEMKSGEAER